MFDLTPANQTSNVTNQESSIKASSQKYKCCLLHAKLQQKNASIDKSICLRWGS
jgi:hypothetical protein